MYSGLKLYILPMDSHNKSFIKSIGLKLYQHPASHLTELAYPLATSKKQYYWYVGFIKSKSSTILKYANPEVVVMRHQEDMGCEGDVEGCEEAVGCERKELDEEFICDILSDYRKQIMTVEDLAIRLENGPDEERLFASLSQVDAKTRLEFEKLLECISSFQQSYSSNN